MPDCEALCVGKIAFICTLVFWVPDFLSVDLPTLRTIPLWIILFLDYHPTEFHIIGFIVWIIATENSSLIYCAVCHGSCKLVPKSFTLFQTLFKSAAFESSFRPETGQIDEANIIILNCATQHNW